MNGVSKSYTQNGKLETEAVYKMGVQDGYDRRYDYETGDCDLIHIIKTGNRMVIGWSKS